MSQELPRNPKNAQSLERLRAKASLALDREEREADSQPQTRRSFTAAVLAAPFVAVAAPQQNKPPIPVYGGPPPPPPAPKTEPKSSQNPDSDTTKQTTQSKTDKKDNKKTTKRPSNKVYGGPKRPPK